MKETSLDLRLSMTIQRQLADELNLSWYWQYFAPECTKHRLAALSNKKGLTLPKKTVKTKIHFI
jgi:hypothetical protein